MILDKIVNSTKIRLEEEKKSLSLKELVKTAEELGKNQKPFMFKKALEKKGLSFITEVKKASPSKGIIAEDFPYVEIGKNYENSGADAISVLTEPEYFMGSKLYLKEIKQNVKIPVLRKDFIIDPYQIYEARTIGADGILLIVSILSKEEIKEFIRISKDFGISCLVEAHDEKEIEIAINSGAEIIGVNNRDLKTFTVDINNSINLRKFVPKEILFVSESGIKTPEDIDNLRKNGVDAVLIGEELMRSKDIKKSLDILRGVSEND